MAYTSSTSTCSAGGSSPAWRCGEREKRDGCARICVCPVYIPWAGERGGGARHCDTLLAMGALQTRPLAGASALGRVMLAARHLEIPRVYRRFFVFLVLASLFLFRFSSPPMVQLEILHVVVKVSSTLAGAHCPVLPLPLFLSLITYFLDRKKTKSSLRFASCWVA